MASLSIFCLMYGYQWYISNAQYWMLTQDVIIYKSLDPVASAQKDEEVYTDVKYLNNRENIVNIPDYLYITYVFGLVIFHTIAYPLLLQLLPYFGPPMNFIAFIINLKSIFICLTSYFGGKIGFTF